MENEFYNLKQGGMTVIEYERRFNQLSRSAPQLVDTEDKKARKFKRGLRANIRNIISGHGEMTFAETFRRAQEIAASMEIDNSSRKQVENQGKKNGRTSIKMKDKISQKMPENL